MTLAYREVSLVPLALEHAADLFRALNADRELWAYLPVRMPASEAEMAAWIALALEQRERKQRVPFAVIDATSGRAVGSTSYLNLSAPDRSLDIGWTWYARSHWRTALNSTCKYLLLCHAFDALGCIRVQFRADLRNTRSQRAIERIGGLREGVLRQVQILYDGHRRDVVVFSILEEEWPVHRARLECVLGSGPIS